MSSRVNIINAHLDPKSEQAMAPTPVLLPGNPMDRGAWWATVHGVARSRTRLSDFAFTSCIGEGNGNPLQCSCLENPRNRGAWWAAVYGVAQSRTRLKRLSSSRQNCSSRGKISSCQGLRRRWTMTMER